MLDAMYYHIALESFRKAEEYWEQVDSLLGQFRCLWQSWDEIVKRYEYDYTAAADELEPLAITMESMEGEITYSLGPFLQAATQTHVFSAAALESHINVRASEHLPHRLFEEFDRLSLEGKWLMLPRILGVEGFDPGRQPFQDMAVLVRMRNQLLHYKGREEPWSPTNPVPSYIIAMGLTLDHSRRSLGIVETMIRTLAHQLGENPPNWLATQGTDYFDFRSA